MEAALLPKWTVWSPELGIEKTDALIIAEIMQAEPMPVADQVALVVGLIVLLCIIIMIIAPSP